MKLAVAQYPVEYHESWPGYTDKISRWVAEAAGAGAQLLVFPEYASMELASLLDRAVQADVRKQLPAMQRFLPEFVELHRRLARAHGVYILAASFPERVGEAYVNRAYFLGPDGQVDFQDKLVMTRFENEKWGVTAGKGLKVFRTPLGSVGVNICYDAEFPQLARALAGGGADVLLVPSCTEFITGYHRVEIGSRARALENQMYAAHAPLIGTAPWNEAIDVNIGAGGVYGPIDHGFSARGDGVVAQGALNDPGWVYADLDLEKLREVRETGHTVNARDWPRAEAAAGGVRAVVF